MIAAPVVTNRHPLSLALQIREAEIRLQHRQGAVRLRGITLGRLLQQRISTPAALLWAGGLGFLLGEFSQPPAPAPATTPAPASSFFETVLTLWRVYGWVDAVLAASVAANRPAV